MTRSILIRCGLCLLALSLGCGRRAKKPEVHLSQVEGRITIGGKAIDHGTVTFIPTIQEKEGGRPGIAKIESDGSFRVGNANPEKPPGMRPGDYVVTVLAMSPTGGHDVARMDAPERYSDPRTSKLRATIAEGGNSLSFNLDPH